MHWIWLTLAIALEVCGTICMKLSGGFSKLAPSMWMAGFYVACFGCLTVALKKFDVSVAYAIWSGLGTALITIAGVMYFREQMTTIKAVSIMLIILGVVGLNLSGKMH